MRASAALKSLGYEPEAWNSPEDALLQAQEGPGLRFLRDGSFPVDLQTRLPGVPLSEATMAEAWGMARPAALAGRQSRTGQTGPTSPTRALRNTGIFVLCPVHEMLLAAAHFCVHLKPPLMVSAKWVTDMLLLVHRNATDRPPRLGPPIEGATFEEKLARLGPAELVWPFLGAAGSDLSDRSDESDGPARGERLWRWADCWEAAERWGIVKETGTVCSTLNAHFGAHIPDVPVGATPLPLDRLLGRGSDHALHGAAAIPLAYAERIARVRALRGGNARLRYLTGLVYPSARSLRSRYGLAKEQSVILYRVVHPFRTLWKLLRGAGAVAWLRLRPPGD